MLDIDLKRLKPPFLVHSDLFRTHRLIRENHNSVKNNSEFAHKHFDFLSHTFGKENLILPSFNYLFPKDRVFDVQDTQSQVGALTNFVLDNQLLKRTKTPIFSFLSNISDLINDHNKPFSKGSVFDFINQNDGTIVFYGTSILSCTFLHYIENQCGPPLYRYDKKFSGVIIDNALPSQTHVEFHVRPSGLNIDYNWAMLFDLLKSEGVIHDLGFRVLAVKARDLIDTWGDVFLVDQFSFLSQETKGAVKQKFNQLGRRFVKKDFEEY